MQRGVQLFLQWAMMQGVAMLLQNRYQRQRLYTRIALGKVPSPNCFFPLFAFVIHSMFHFLWWTHSMFYIKYRIIFHILIPSLRSLHTHPFFFLLWNFFVRMTGHKNDMRNFFLSDVCEHMVPIIILLLFSG